MLILEEPAVSLVVTGLLAGFFLVMSFIAGRGRHILLVLCGLLVLAFVISLGFVIAT